MLGRINFALNTRSNGGMRELLLRTGAGLRALTDLPLVHHGRWLAAAQQAANAFYTTLGLPPPSAYMFASQTWQQGWPSAGSRLLAVAATDAAAGLAGVAAAGNGGSRRQRRQAAGSKAQDATPATRRLPAAKPQAATQAPAQQPQAAKQPAAAALDEPPAAAPSAATPAAAAPAAAAKPPATAPSAAPAPAATAPVHVVPAAAARPPAPAVASEAEQLDAMHSPSSAASGSGSGSSSGAKSRRQVRRPRTRAQTSFAAPVSAAAAPVSAGHSTSNIAGASNHHRLRRRAPAAAKAPVPGGGLGRQGAGAVVARTPPQLAGLLTLEAVAASGASTRELRVYLLQHSVRGAWADDKGGLQVRQCDTQKQQHGACACAHSLALGACTA